MLSVEQEAQSVAKAGGALSIIGWTVVFVTLIMGVVWWIRFASTDVFNILDAFRITLNAIIVSLTGGFILAGLGSSMKLLAAYTTSRS